MLEDTDIAVVDRPVDPAIANDWFAVGQAATPRPDSHCAAA